MTEIGEMSVEDQLRDELRRVRHDLEHVVQERDAAERERDRLGRQQQAIIDLAHRAEAEKRSITPGEIYQLVITDPGDDERPWYSDVDVAVENGVVKLYGDGDQLIADLSREKAETLWYMLRDGIVEHGRQLQMITSKGCEAS